MQSFDIDRLLSVYRYPAIGFLLGIVLLIGGFFVYRNNASNFETSVEVLGEEESVSIKEFTVEISGEVKNPGVYKIDGSSRIDDLIKLSGGLTDNYDKVWVEKYLNRAALLMDGQKVFIPPANNHSSNSSAKKEGIDQTISTTISSDSSDIININTASLEELMSLTGIGQKYGESIIEHRPYSSAQELVFKKVIGQNLFEKIKDKISVY